MNKYRSLLKTLAYTFSGFVIVLAGLKGKDIPFTEQWPLYEALRTTASIIFAVVGAWLAIIYPDRLKFSFQKEDGETVKIKANGGMRRLFTPIANSTAILCIILLIGILAPLVKNIEFLLQYKEQLRSISYILLVILTLWQLWTVILTLIPADVIKSKSDEEVNRHDLKKNFGKLTSVSSKKDVDTN